jgi:Skp family chaperone for outer membrane proteins
MTRNNLMLALLVACLAAVCGFAQGPATPARPPSTNPQVGKIAVVFSEEFQNPKTGIARFIVLQNNLNAEFQKTQTELNQMSAQINQLNDDVNKTKSIADPKVTQQKIDQLDQLKKTYQRRGEDAQAAYRRRREEVLGPFQIDVSKALDAYAKSHALTMIIDGSQVQGLIYASESIDITKAFISDYNTKNPVTAPVTTPK